MKMHLVVVLAPLAFMACGRNEPTKAPLASESHTHSSAEQQTVESQEVHPSVDCVAQHLRGLYPESYEALEWGEVQKREDGNFDVWHKYRRKNEAGRLMTKDMIFTHDTEGKILGTYRWVMQIE